MKSERCSQEIAGNFNYRSPHEGGVQQNLPIENEDNGFDSVRQGPEDVSHVVFIGPQNSGPSDPESKKMGKDKLLQRIGKKKRKFQTWRRDRVKLFTPIEEFPEKAKFIASVLKADEQAAVKLAYKMTVNPFSKVKQAGRKAVQEVKNEAAKENKEFEELMSLVGKKILSESRVAVKDVKQDLGALARVAQKGETLIRRKGRRAVSSLKRTEDVSSVFPSDIQSEEAIEETAEVKEIIIQERKFGRIRTFLENESPRDREILSGLIQLDWLLRAFAEVPETAGYVKRLTFRFQDSGFLKDKIKYYDGSFRLSTSSYRPMTLVELGRKLTMWGNTAEEFFEGFPEEFYKLQKIQNLTDQQKLQHYSLGLLVDIMASDNSKKPMDSEDMVKAIALDYQTVMDKNLDEALSVESDKMSIRTLYLDHVIQLSEESGLDFDQQKFDEAEDVHLRTHKKYYLKRVAQEKDGSEIEAAEYAHIALQYAVALGEDEQVDLIKKDICLGLKALRKQISKDFGFLEKRSQGELYYAKKARERLGTYEADLGIDLSGDFTKLKARLFLRKLFLLNRLIGLRRRH